MGGGKTILLFILFINGGGKTILLFINGGGKQQLVQAFGRRCCWYVLHELIRDVPDSDFAG